MSIFVAVRVRPTDSSQQSSGAKPARTTTGSASDPGADDDPSVCGTLRFINESHITFTQDAMECLEDDRNHGAAQRSSPRSRTPVARRAVSAGSSMSRARAKSPSVTSSAMANAQHLRAAHPLPQQSHRTKFARPVFEFDGCFSSQPNHLCFGSQYDLYERLGAPILERFLSGYNCCLMAYGQTGSGKTYSMLGPHGDELVQLQRARATSNRMGLDLPPRPAVVAAAKTPLVRRLQCDEERGLILRLCEHLFSELSHRESTGRRASINALRQGLGPAREATASMVKFDLEVRYYQIYREKVYCLLSNSSGLSTDHMEATKPLKVRESAIAGPYVEGLTTVHLTTFDDAVKLLDRGTRHRRVASTTQNMHSSRSHAVLSLRLRCIRSSHDASFTSQMNLVDLAGSERTGRFNDSAARVAESSDINCSLSTLGKVIHVLATHSRARSSSPLASAATTGRASSKGSVSNGSAHVPYRESVLTFLLRDSIGGNSRTTILSTISPMLADVAETLSTLRYASKARHIVNTPVVNTDAKSTLLVATLREEVDQLRHQLQATLSHSHHHDLEERIEAKQRQLDEYEQQLIMIQEQRGSWEEEKIAMMDRVMLLEHEADSLRGELNAARETADAYREKLQRLTAVVESQTEGRSDQSHAEQYPLGATPSSRSETMSEPTTAVDQATALPSSHRGSVGAQDNGVLAGRATPPTTSSRAIVFAASRASGSEATSVPATSGGAVPERPGQAVHPGAEDRSHPANGSLSPGRASFVSGSRPVNSAAVGATSWMLPARYQWLLQPSRSNSRASSSESDAPTSSGVSANNAVGVVASATAAVNSGRPPTFQPPPPLGAPRRTLSPTVPSTSHAPGATVVGGGSARPPLPPSRASPSDSEDDVRLDNDSFLRAAESAGIDVAALLDAKRREKRREKKKKLAASGAPQDGSDGRQTFADPSTTTGAVGPRVVVEAQSTEGPFSGGSGAVAGASLPPPRFAQSGAAPPPLRIPTLNLPVHPAVHSATTPSYPRPKAQSQPQQRPTALSGTTGNGPGSNQQPLPASLERFRQKMRDQSPPAPIRPTPYERR